MIPHGDEYNWNLFRRKKLRACPKCCVSMLFEDLKILVGEHTCLSYQVAKEV